MFTAKAIKKFFQDNKETQVVVKFLDKSPSIVCSLEEAKSKSIQKGCGVICRSVDGDKYFGRFNSTEGRFYF